MHLGQSGQQNPSPQKVQKEKSSEEQMKQSSQKAKNKQGEQQKKKQSQKKQNAMISFNKLSVGTVSSSSGVFNGKNVQFGWSSQSKSNTGFGKIGGHNNKANKNTNVVFDNDQVDTPIDDRDTMWGTIPPT
ncbi:hypothetical protein [Lentibacillus sp. Marseille-P4043]|uniref:hypothetical protein n=1 Tax=Lentibacillus sp. Marseille-P4043 TaxID=2040293 RepID=UPI00131A51E4|nr:hypothetical protein [Lentibacillus sp. Marseille-P4043]